MLIIASSSVVPDRGNPTRNTGPSDMIRVADREIPGLSGQRRIANRGLGVVHHDLRPAPAPEQAGAPEAARAPRPWVEQLDRHSVAPHCVQLADRRSDKSALGPGVEGKEVDDPPPVPDPAADGEAVQPTVPVAGPEHGPRPPGLLPPAPSQVPAGSMPDAAHGARH